MKKNMTKNKNTFDLKVTVNCDKITRTIPTTMRLLDFIRDELRLTGAKEVCGQGECGACTVVMEGKTVNSCLILAVEAHESNITTIEGITKSGEPDDLVAAFVKHHSVQCGYCIPGMVLSGRQLFAETVAPNRDEIKHALSGNMCRCTGYVKIIDAVESVGKDRK